MAFSAVVTSTRCAGPMMSPDRDRRVTVASSVHIVSGNATGASVWVVNALRDPGTSCGGRDFVDQHWADGVIAVPVAPVERVHRERRRDHAQIHQRLHLILALELPVDQYGAPVRAPMLGLGRAQGGDQQVRCRLTIGMHEDLNVVGIGPVHRRQHLLARHGGITGVARREIPDRGVIEPVTPSGEPLR